MAKFQYKEIQRSIARSEVGKKRVETVVRGKFEENKEILLKEFDEHPVTKEIEEGGENISGTLGGYGNLRAFIGFDAGSDPIGPVRDVLENQIVLSQKAVAVASNKINYKFSLRIPKEELRNAAPMPWENGLSWIAGIETGRISGLANFIFGKFNNPPSRSEEGIQAKHPIRSAVFRKTPYINDLFNKFVARFK